MTATVDIITKTKKEYFSSSISSVVVKSDTSSSKGENDAYRGGEKLMPKVIKNLNVYLLK
jgi:hypothetical protein